MERNIIFKCPRTGMNVQHWLPGPMSGAADTHVSVRCPACGSLHFVNIATGKMLSEGNHPASNDYGSSRSRRPA
nr:hypothetical protein [Bradyrhizobium sp. 191]